MVEQPTLTGKLLLKMTREHKWRQVRRSLAPVDSGRAIDSGDVVITKADIEDMADTLKGNVFYVPTFVYTEAFELAGLSVVK